MPTLCSLKEQRALYLKVLLVFKIALLVIKKIKKEMLKLKRTNDEQNSKKPIMIINY